MASEKVRVQQNTAIETRSEAEQVESAGNEALLPSSSVSIGSNCSIYSTCTCLLPPAHRALVYRRRMCFRALTDCHLRSIHDAAFFAYVNSSTTVYYDNSSKT